MCSRPRDAMSQVTWGGSRQGRGGPVAAASPLGARRLAASLPSSNAPDCPGARRREDPGRRAAGDIVLRDPPAVLSQGVTLATCGFLS